ncbi:MAG: H-NS histone family protein [Rubrivivax sp.]|jgi:DNA-binding protein H-NS|nr:H-NS histone family protein [Rubrivivax sp.]
MAKTYEQLQRQIASLQAEAEKLRRKELGEVIGRIREAVSFYGITAEDLGLDAKSSARPKAKGRAKPGRQAAKGAQAAVAFRNEAGQTWGGRGKRPQWLRDALAAGHTLDEFRVAAG